MRITWLLQGGFLFNIASTRLVVDAYLSDIVEKTQGLTRLTASPMTLEKLCPDYWLATHDHMDHLDPPTVPLVADTFPHCRFIAPPSVQKHLAELSVEPNRIVSLDVDTTIDLGQFLVAGVPAFHSDPDAVGLVIESESSRVYVTGDSELTDELRNTATTLGPIDVLFVCINGKLGNMGIADAVELAKLVQPSLAVPMHYGLFAENTADPEDFIQACKEHGIPAAALLPGREYDISRIIE